VSFLIPELVSGVQFKKGPYFADEGDFSAAGAANINYVNRLDRPMLRASAGNDGWGRIFGAASPRVGGGYLVGALEVNHNDGPWVRPDDYRKVNSVLRFSRGDNRNGFSLTGMGYWASWDATDQVPERAITSGLISRFGLLDPSDGGKADRQSLAAEFQRSTGPSSLRATGFVLRNSLNLFSNFTFFLDDPDNGDQFEQAERRIAAGGRITYRRLGHFLDRHTESAIGIQLRHDWLDPVGLYRTVARQRIATSREDEVGQTMAGVYAQTEVEWTRTLRTTLGLRADRYQFSVTSDNPVNSGDGSDGLVSPKVGAIFGPWSGTEIYVNVVEWRDWLPPLEQGSSRAGSVQSVQCRGVGYRLLLPVAAARRAGRRCRRHPLASGSAAIGAHRHSVFVLTRESAGLGLRGWNPVSSRHTSTAGFQIAGRGRHHEDRRANVSFEPREVRAQRAVAQIDRRLEVQQVHLAPVPEFTRRARNLVGESSAAGGVRGIHRRTSAMRVE
jgi:hypothetical protein